MPGSWFVKPPALAKLIKHVLVCHERCSVKGAKAQAPSHLCPGQAGVEKGVKVIGLGKGTCGEQLFGCRDLSGSTGDIKLLWALADEAGDQKILRD